MIYHIAEQRTILFFFFNSAPNSRMALQLKKRNYKVPILTAGAVVFGAGLLLIKTYPHLISFLPLPCAKAGKETKEDNTPVEVDNTEGDEELGGYSSKLGDDSLVDVAEWSDENLRSFLMEVSIQQAEHSSKNTNDNRKKSILLPMLIMTALLPLLNQFKRVLSIDLNVLLTIRIILFKFLLVLKRIIH